MKKHLKIKPERNSLNYSPIKRRFDKKTYTVNRTDKYNEVHNSFISSIKSNEENKAFVRTVLDEALVPNNVVLSIEQDPAVTDRLALERLDNRNVKLLSVNTIDGLTTANISIDENKVEKFSKLINQYQTEDTPKGAPKNQTLVEPIRSIRRTLLSDLWFSASPYPEDTTEIIDTELWFDISENRGPDAVSEIEQRISLCANLAGVTIKNHRLTFKDRLIKIASGALDSLEVLHNLTNLIVEIRPATTICSDFLNIATDEQHAWVEQVSIEKAQYPAKVFVIDSGVNIGHPLLRNLTDVEHHVQYDLNWPAGDQLGHGTWMAGAAIYGDLKHALQNSKAQVYADLESAKIITPAISNDPDLYGVITEDVVYQMDSINPSDRRIYTLATTADYSLLGSPSSWSAKIDELASRNPDDPSARLFLISAGNFVLNDARDIPTNNLNNTVQDPASAYNALTVGYWASEANINQAGYELYTELTDIGPTSTSSNSWYKSSPLKPEVVFEGGNYGYDPDLDFASELEELSILTVNHEFAVSGNQFNYFGETSAATALASNFTSRLWSEYPNYWPETIRGLVVHSAEWPEKIRSRFEPLSTKSNLEALIRLSGYGYPNLQKALTSGAQNVSLVIEDQIQPYTEDGKMNEMLLYALPWPENELMKLSGETVKLKVTLSYFIEPNPGERGWSNKFKYCSHGLRFDFNTPSENKDEFAFRINQKFREERPDLEATENDPKSWLLGANLRSKGSVHSDTWVGTAQDLAAKQFIAVYPVAGWWRDLKKENRQSSIARFSLIVSIETPENNLEIYNEIESLVVTENLIENSVLLTSGQ